jgi:hypothetical protein
MHLDAGTQPAARNGFTAPGPDGRA